MVSKEDLRLGQKVLFGRKKREGVVDALTQTYVALAPVGGGRIVMVEYANVYVRE